MQLLSLLLPAAAAAYGTRVGREGHGVYHPTPECCSASTSKDCSRSHPCKATAETDVEAIHGQFVAWLAKHEKTYATVEEWAHRLTVFAQNAAQVAAHDAKAAGYAVSLASRFADWTEAEFAAYQKLKPSNSTSAPNLHKVSGKTNPDSVDWRDEGIVADIKDQGQCGSCWTFSTVVSIEGQHAKATGSLQTLSEQNLVDCVKDDRISGEVSSCCSGCEGGLMDNAFDYIIKQQGGGIDTEDSYSYTGEDGSCDFATSSEGATISSWTDVTAADEDALEDAIANVGPVSVALDASKQWQTYSGGILVPKSVLGCSSNPNHADHGVAVVGYGSEDGTDYWIVRNSWGTSWGEDGYIRIIRGQNACGIANYASYPVV